MLSVIICSKKPKLLRKVSENIEETIGIPHEIISINNESGKYSIFQAYNLGAARSQLDYLCFMHEDVSLITKDWGKIVIETLRDVSIGLIGIAGSTIKTKAPGSWRTGDLSLDRENVIQYYNDGRAAKRNYNNPLNEEISDVVCVDGVWMCCRKAIWAQNKFDESRYKGFHFYDLDFSMQIFRKSKVVVIYSILIEHYSKGNADASWLENAMIFDDKWGNSFPVCVHPMGQNVIKNVEMNNYLYFINHLIHEEYHKKFIIKYTIKLLISYKHKLNNSYEILLQLLRTYFPRTYVLIRNHYRSFASG
jgi:hypothetical protein